MHTCSCSHRTAITVIQAELLVIMYQVDDFWCLHWLFWCRNTSEITLTFKFTSQWLLFSFLFRWRGMTQIRLMQAKVYVTSSGPRSSLINVTPSPLWCSLMWQYKEKCEPLKYWAPEICSSRKDPPFCFSTEISPIKQPLREILYVCVNDWRCVHACVIVAERRRQPVIMHLFSCTQSRNLPGCHAY